MEAMELGDCCPALSSVDRSRLKDSQQWDIVLLGVTLKVASGEVEESLEDMLKVVEACTLDTPGIFHNGVQSGSLAVLSLSSNWIYITDVHHKVLLSRHEIQDISSAGYVKDDGMYILLIKCWQPPGQRYLALAINCLEERAVTSICKNVWRRFSDLCRNEETGQVYSRLSIRVADTNVNRKAATSGAPTTPNSSRKNAPVASPVVNVVAVSCPGFTETASESPVQDVQQPCQAAVSPALEVMVTSTEQSEPPQTAPAVNVDESPGHRGADKRVSKEKSRKAKQHGLRWLVKSALRRSSETADPIMETGSDTSLPRNKKKTKKGRVNSMIISSPVLDNGQRDQSMIYRSESASEGTRTVKVELAHSETEETAFTSSAASSSTPNDLPKSDSIDGASDMSPTLDDAVFSRPAKPASLPVDSPLQDSSASRDRKASLGNVSARNPLKKRARSIDALNEQGSDSDFSTLPKKGRRKKQKHRRRASLPPPPSPPGTPPAPPSPSGDETKLTPNKILSQAAPVSVIAIPDPEPIYATIRHKSVSAGCLLARSPSPEPPMLPSRSLDAGIFSEPERRREVAAIPDVVYSSDDDDDSLYEKLPAHAKMVSPDLRPPMPIPSDHCAVSGSVDTTSPPQSVLALRADKTPSPSANDESALKGSSQTVGASSEAASEGSAERPGTKQQNAGEAPWFLASDSDEDTTAPYSKLKGKSAKTEAHSAADNQTKTDLPTAPTAAAGPQHRPSWYNYNHKKKSGPPILPYSPRIPRPSAVVAPNRSGLVQQSSGAPVPTGLYESIHSGPEPLSSANMYENSYPPTSANTMTSRVMHKKLAKRVSSHGGRKRSRTTRPLPSAVTSATDSSSTVDALVRQVMSSKSGQEHLRYAIGQALHHSVSKGTLGSNV
ncbi:uncharacterized protein LOC135826298 isoform X1 [Sycon ciliatum]|uniref:uncharacterized protein LOC135826298 isoform X1 n=2 Tax=Sycon ciliatum TaxID=27933 RepID=UPI0031F60EB8